MGPCLLRERRHPSGRGADDDVDLPHARLPEACDGGLDEGRPRRGEPQQPLGPAHPTACTRGEHEPRHPVTHHPHTVPPPHTGAHRTAHARPPKRRPGHPETPRVLRSPSVHPLRSDARTAYRGRVVCGLHRRSRTRRHVCRQREWWSWQRASRGGRAHVRREPTQRGLGRRLLPSRGRQGKGDELEAVTRYRGRPLAGGIPAGGSGGRRGVA